MLQIHQEIQALPRDMIHIASTREQMNENNRSFTYICTYIHT